MTHGEESVLALKALNATRGGTTAHRINTEARLSLG